MAWDRNLEPDVNQYTVYWGTNSGNYLYSTNAGNNTNVVVMGLQQGVTYYFVVTAWNTSGLESDPSVEVSYTVPVVPVNPLENWRLQFFTQADLADPTKEATLWGDNADPDNDGRQNLLEFAFGLNPTNSEPAQVSVGSGVDKLSGTGYLYLAFKRWKNQPLLQYSVEVSSDRANWNSGSGYALQVSVMDVDADFEVAKCRNLAAIAPGQPQFMRLRVGADGAESVTEIFVGSATVVEGAGVTGSRFTCFSLPMVSPVAYGGRISARGANTLTDDSSQWTEGQFNGDNGSFYAEFDSGLMADILDTAAATRTLTFAGDLPGSVAQGDRYRIRKHLTLGDLFGENNEAGLAGAASASQADNILLHIAQTQETYTFFYCSVAGYQGWYRSDFRPAENTVVYPEQGLMVCRKSPVNLTVYFHGPTKEGGIVVPVFTGYNLVGTLKSQRSLSLAELNLYTGDPATGMAGGNSLSSADNLLVIGPNAAITSYFYCDYAGFEGWYDAAFTPADGTLISAGSAFFIQRKSPRGLFYWSIPPE